MDCSIEGCTRVLRRRGLCKKHYQQGLYDGSVERVRIRNIGENCLHKGCLNKAKTRNLCPKHYARLNRTGSTDDPRPNYNPDGSALVCVVERCVDESKIRRLCIFHDGQRRRGLDVEEMYVPGEVFSCRIPECLGTRGRRGMMCDRHTRTRWLYSIPLEKFIEMHQPENRICGNPGCRSAEELHVDHDHSCCGYVTHTTKLSCGKCVRGWLCGSCNVALGHLRENPRRIEGLLRYLENV